MTRRESSFRILPAIALVTLTVTKAWPVPDGTNPSALNNSHASQKTYSAAIISLRDSKTGNLFYVESNGRRIVAFNKMERCDGIST